MKDIRLVATDLDRTLVTSSGGLPPDLDSYISRLTDARIVFVPASGRPRATLRAMFPSANRSVGYISDNGAVVGLGNEILDTSTFAPSVHLEMVESVREEGVGIPALSTLDGSFTLERFREYEDMLRQFFYDLRLVPDLGDVTAASVKFSVFYPRRDSRDHYDYINDLWGADYSVVIAGPDWIDITNRGVNKGHGLKVLGEKLGIGPDQMMAFGDTDNDFAMIEYAEHSYAVANADERIKEAAAHTTLSNDEHGVLAILDRLLTAVE